jgi:plasmid maintenance system antidote protein VapI
MSTVYIHVPPPHALLDAILRDYKLKNDAALARYLEVAPPIISKIRHDKLAVGPYMILKIHEKTEMSVKDIKFLLRQTPELKAA